MKKAIYTEDDWVAEVEIVDDRSCDENESYKLKVIKTIQESNIYTNPENGYEFDVWQQKKCPITFDLEIQP